MGRLVFQNIVLLGLMMQASKLLAYPTPVDFSGRLLRWHIGVDAPELTYEVRADEEEFLTEYGPLVDLAAAKWSDVQGSYIRLVAPADPNTAKITIKFRKQIDGGSVAAGYSWFDESDPTDGSLHCTIEIQTETGMGEWSMGKTILHEMGHCLGLGHSLVAESIMSYDLDKNDFNLDLDDRAAIALLYPADGHTPKMPKGCAVTAEQTAHPLVTWVAVSLPLWFPLMFPHSSTPRRRFWTKRAG